MKVKNLFMVMLLGTTLQIFLSSCNRGGKWVEYWKVYIVENYRHNIVNDYLKNRFDSMAPDPNEYQKAYYRIAECATWNWNLYKIHDNDEMENEVRSNVDDNIKGYSSYFNFTKKVLLNMTSHPDLYIENACKIIGPVADLKEEMASHVDVKKVEEVNIADYKRYNVLYSIDEEYYVICTITEKANDKSEIQVIEKDESINEILDCWEAMHVEL